MLFSGSCSGPGSLGQLWIHTSHSAQRRDAAVTQVWVKEQKPSSLAGTKDSQCLMDSPLSPEINLP